MTSTKNKPLRVLLIEDDTDVADSVSAAIKKAFPESKTDIVNDFGDGLNDLKEFNRDLVILDLFEGKPALGDKSGEPIWQEVWNHQFTPIVIYSAAPEAALNPAFPDGHPFVAKVKKGVGSLDKLVEKISEYLPEIGALRSVQKEIGTAFHSVLGTIAPTIWKAVPKEERSEMLVRTTRRRIAATMDLKSADGAELAPWERYVCPPLPGDPLAGDLIRLAGRPENEAIAYRFILSPSCDMQFRQDGKVNLKQVLVAKCTDFAAFLKASSITGARFDKIKDKLPGLFTRPNVSGIVPFPRLPGVIPQMAADLRDLELIPLVNIEGPHCSIEEYKRVASIDSPFREHLMFGYLEVAARPGCPNSDWEKWGKDVETLLAGKTK